MTQTGANTGHLVGRARRAHTAAADHDAPNATPIENCQAYRFGIIGIVIAGVGIVGAKVKHAVPKPTQVITDILLEFITRVVGANCDYHVCLSPISFQKCSDSNPAPLTPP